jgi:hypothetical protein
MPLVKTAIVAAAAALIGSIAYAQTDNGAQAPQQPPPPADNAQAAPADASAAAGAAGNASATVGANGVITIASQPVPDTKENRKAFGQPLSRAGRRTAAKGN